MFRRTAALVASGAVALGGIALLVPTAASAQPDAAAATATRLLTPAQRQELRRTEHLKLTKHTRKHGTVTFLVQRGVVDAVTPTSIGLTSKDGYHHTYVVGGRTKVRDKGAAVPLSDVKVGERAMVLAVATRNGDVVRRISCLQPAVGATA